MCRLDLIYGFIAVGWDLGCPERASLPTLSLAERMSIAKSRVLSTAIHVNVAKKVNKMKGHTICFPDNAPSTCGKIVPCAEFVTESIRVVFEGPKDSKLIGSRLEGLLRQLGALKINSKNVIEWLWALKFLSPTYYDLEIADNVGTVLDAISTRLVQNVEHFVTNSTMSKAAEMQSADITRANDLFDAGYEPKAPDEGRSSVVMETIDSHPFIDIGSAAGATDVMETMHSFSSMDIGSPTGATDVMDTMHSFCSMDIGSPTGSDDGDVCECSKTPVCMDIDSPAVALANKDGDDDDDYDGITVVPDVELRSIMLIPPMLSNESKARRDLLIAVQLVVDPTVADSNKMNVKVPDPQSMSFHREDEPLNSYLEQNAILSGGFPFVFVLGVPNKVTGPLDLCTRRWLMFNQNRTPSRNAQLCFHLHDTEQRASNGREVKLLIQRDEKKWAEFYDLAMCDEFAANLKLALVNPDGEDAKSLVKKINDLIIVPAGKCKFTGYDRATTAKAQLFALVRFCGLPNMFLTVGPDETRSVLVARLACHGARHDGYCTGGGYGYFHPYKSQNTRESLYEEVNLLPSIVQDAEKELNVIWQQEIQAEIRYVVCSIGRKSWYNEGLICLS